MKATTEGKESLKGGFSRAELRRAALAQEITVGCRRAGFRHLRRWKRNRIGSGLDNPNTTHCYRGRSHLFWPSLALSHFSCKCRWITCKKMWQMPIPRFTTADSCKTRLPCCISGSDEGEIWDCSRGDIIWLPCWPYVWDATGWFSDLHWR